MHTLICVNRTQTFSIFFPNRSQQCWRLSLSQCKWNMSASEAWSAAAWFKPIKTVSVGCFWFRSDCHWHVFGCVAGAEPASAAAAAASVCGTVRELGGASLKQEGWKDLATHLHVMPMKGCLQLDLQRKSDISAPRSTSPGGRGLESRATEQERSTERERAAHKE